MIKDSYRVKELEEERDQIFERLAQIQEEIDFWSHSRKPDLPKLRYVYAIECEGGYFYIGQTSDVARRFQEHLAGKGAWFTRVHKPLRLLERKRVGHKTMREALKDETQLAARYMFQYGVHRVRGGNLIQRNVMTFINEANIYSPVGNGRTP